ncbi:hypothetical protein [Streptomyces sp. NBC_00448]|uniref:hypothetical protein n=1 Tax=Streptomyces sp. NBC_00448 TaxID=2903652 RepID=UPI002E228359
MSRMAGGPRAARLAVRCVGTALVVAACDPPAAVHGSKLMVALVVVAAALAWWASPMVDERPAQTSMRWPALAARRRCTVLAAASIVIAAVTDPPVWLGACVGALLLAYLLLTDAWTTGATAPTGRPEPGTALVTAAACALVFLAAEAPLAHTSWARLVAAPAVAATTTCLALALRHRGAPADRGGAADHDGAGGPGSPGGTRRTGGAGGGPVAGR